MMSRSSLRAGPRAVRCFQCGQKRGLAAPASGSFAYQTSDANGVKYASRDLSGPTTTLALVSRAGTRFQPLPGLSEGLEKFAFKNTEKRSALRITREVELLGGELFAYHGRENLVLGARFLRDDLPYFVELLAETASQTRFEPYILAEEITPYIKLAQKEFLGSTKAMALASVHSTAFHRGLGTPVHPSSSVPLRYLDAESIESFASVAYSKSNFSLVANGADHGEFSKWMGEFFKGYKVSPIGGAQGIQGSQTKYHGGEERIAHGSGNTMVLAFPGSSSFTGGFYKPEIQVLASLLGGQTSIKWSPGFSILGKASADISGASIKTSSEIYSDAGLLTITINGSARSVAEAAKAAVKAVKDIAAGQIAKDDIKKAIANAKFKELEFGQNVNAAIELTGAGLVHGGKAYQIDETAKAIDGVTEEQVKKAAKTLLDNKASVAAVGDLFVLPYAEELGLNV